MEDAHQKGFHGKNNDIYAKLREMVNKGAEKISKKYGKSVASWLLLLPDLFALCSRLTFDPRVSLKSKGLMGFAAFYVLSPVDLMPEGLLGPLGLLDDLAVVILALKKMKDSQEDENILRELWDGDTDIIDLIDRVASKLDKFLEEKVLAAIKKRIGGK